MEYEYSAKEANREITNWLLRLAPKYTFKRVQVDEIVNYELKRDGINLGTMTLYLGGKYFGLGECDEPLQDVESSDEIARGHEFTALVKQLRDHLDFLKLGIKAIVAKRQVPQLAPTAQGDGAGGRERKHMKERRDLVEELHAEGLTQEQIAEQLKVSVNTVKNDAKARNLKWH